MSTREWSPPELLKISGSFWETCALHAGVKLEVFTPLAARPQTVAELSAELDVDQRALAMLLDALAAMQLLEKRNEPLPSQKPAKKVACTVCGAMILPMTAEDTGGLCMPCSKK